MDYETALYLIAPEGRALLSLAAGLLSDRTGPAQAIARLRQGASPERAAAAWEMADLRRRGAAKFGDPVAGMFFTRESLEQASGARASAHHARRFTGAGYASVTDLCGGIGADTLAFASAGLTVRLVERDPLRALFAAENARACGLDSHVAVSCADATAFAVETGAFWLDPDRRPGGHRTTDPDRGEPPLSLIRTLLRDGAEAGGVKLAPAVDHDIAAAYDGSLEFLSDDCECKEAVLWVGSLACAQATPAVTILTAGGPVSWNAQLLAESLPVPGGPFLYEPDPALIRSGRVDELAAWLGATAVHPKVAYLIGPGQAAPIPFARSYRIIEQMPYHPKKLQRLLSDLEIGRIVIKKRGVDLLPTDVERALRLKGDREAVVALYRDGKSAQVVVCEPPASGTAPS